jgi:DNA-binding CsgD family transcriptional regulator/tetratricopeptide (TPR) repeat protein
MGATAALERGRAAVSEHRWREACERLTEARAASADGLAGPDLELLATASLLRGQTTAAVEMMTNAHDLYLARGDTVGAARTAGWLALELLEIGDLPLSGTWISRGMRLVARLDDSDPVGGRVALVPAALTGLFVGNFEEAVRKFEEIAVIAERTGDRELAAHAAFGRGKCLTTVGRTAEGLASLDRAMAAVAEGGVSPGWTCVFFRVVLDVAHESFDLRRAQRWTSAFEEWCRPQPDLVAYSGQCHAYRAQLLLLHGDWAGASAAATLAEERLRAGDFTAPYVANYQLAELHRLRWEHRAADEHYRRAGASGWDSQPGLALLRIAQGSFVDAQAMLHHASAGADDGTRRRLLPALVEVELAAGDVAAARRAADELNELRRGRPTPMLDAVAALGDARVLLAEGDAAGALEAAKAARSAWAGLDAPYEVARCRVLEGRILRELGQADAAAAALDAARAVFLELGARSGLSELNLLTGERPPGALTDREVEVLRLVSTGLTNRGIAGRLSLSEKTVARHLSNIFGKLGLSSRSAATAYAYENGFI